MHNLSRKSAGSGSSPWRRTSAQVTSVSWASSFTQRPLYALFAAQYSADERGSGARLVSAFGKTKTAAPTNLLKKLKDRGRAGAENRVMKQWIERTRSGHRPRRAPWAC